MNVLTPHQELLYRTVATYLAEGAVALILMAVFFYFSKIYHRRFLNTWAFSWLALSVFMFATAWISLYGVNQSSGKIRLVVSIVSITACFLQAALVLIGSLELTSKKIISTRQLALWALGIVLFSSALTLFKNEVEGAALIRYFLRIGVRYLLVGIVFIVAGAIILKSPLFTRG